jgi:hypothetical protein
MESKRFTSRDVLCNKTYLIKNKHVEKEHDEVEFIEQSY